jgi:hypothetical protein
VVHTITAIPWLRGSFTGYHVTPSKACLKATPLQSSLDPSVEGRLGFGAVDGAAAALQIPCLFNAAKCFRTLAELA